jgi:hypothetical protein
MTHYTRVEDLTYTRKAMKERERPENIIKQKLFKAWQQGYLTNDEWVLLYGDDKWLKWATKRDTYYSSFFMDLLDVPDRDVISW